jgi:hypothetical protein
MPPLNEQLSNFVDTINQGPGALNPDLFAGPIDRILLGLKAHANTISHARLVALEETFPMTRADMGEEHFNRLSRLYTETEIGRASDNNRIGAGFLEFLGAQETPQDILDLAHIEWAWLESYNAAEADALSITALAGLDETAMLALAIDRHPAARMVMLHAPLSNRLAELGDTSGAVAILITRPDSQALLTPLTAITASIFAATASPSTMGNLLSLALEQGEDDAPLEPILTLIQTGALVAPRDL